MPRFSTLVFAVSFLVYACGSRTTIVIWTDKPEFALYAQYYNVQHTEYKAEVHYIESPVTQLDTRKDKPDVIIARYLNNTAAYSRLENLNFLFNRKYINENSFYPVLLESGRKKNTQYFIPVSFNLPLCVFAANSARAETAQLLELDTLKKEGLHYNEQSGGGWERLGFSPLWDKTHGFIMLMTRLCAVDFHEAGGTLKLAWNNDALKTTVHSLREWINDSTGSIQAEDDFIYKYFFNPEYKLLADGRILFAYMRSDDFWMLHDEQNALLDFRWLSRAAMIPVASDTTAFAVYKWARAKKGAADFARWFFNEETQEMLLEKNNTMHMNTAVFGIAGGFSTLHTVTDFFFPKYYKGLMGRTPPAAALTPPAALPENWPELRNAVILPWLLSAVRNTQEDERTLAEQLDEWFAIQQGQF
ncbi:MAG: hypothetical protein LBD22_04060 [Spirochaetaceae bacterium]|jgi:ABC-type glycerol-3-phosphate transport system substrate-binding protein|nr:hypothetical protein [Spirochaetaceae bacterium]